jgi:DeoR/GlpR family transcriptional regulator of sugar metabolism
MASQKPRRRHRQSQIMKWARQRNRAFKTGELMKALKLSSNSAQSALKKLCEQGSLTKLNPHGAGYEIAKTELPTDKKESAPVHEEIQTHIAAYATGHVSAWLECYAASHGVPTTSLTRWVGKALQASAGR